MTKLEKKIKCIALTRRGKQCPNDAIDGTSYCSVASHKLIGKESELKWLKIIALFAKKLWTIAGIISIILAFYIFYPQVSVSVLPSLNPQDAMQTPFVISNDGNVTIKDVEVTFLPYNVQLTSGGRMTSEGGGIVFPTNVAPVMKSHEKHTIFIGPGVIFGPIASADMAISVHFNLFHATLPFWPFKNWKSIFRFTTVKDINGILNWYPQPDSK